MNIPLTPLRFLRHAARQYPLRTAVLDGSYRATYAEFAGRAARLAGALPTAGIQAGDRVPSWGQIPTSCLKPTMAYWTHAPF